MMHKYRERNLIDYHKILMAFRKINCEVSVKVLILNMKTTYFVVKQHLQNIEKFKVFCLAHIVKLV